MIPTVFALGPDLKIAIPIALLWLLGLVGLPAFTCWFALKKKKMPALILGIPALAVAAYVTISEFPGQQSEVVFWLFTGCLPLLGSLFGVVMACRLHSSTDGD